MSASRLHRKVSLWTLASSAVVLSGFLSHRSEANPPGRPPGFSAKSAPRVAPKPAVAATPSVAANSVIAAPEVSVKTQASPVVVPVTSPAPDAAKAPARILQIDASGVIAALPAPPADISNGVSTENAATSSALALNASAPSLASQSQPVSAPQPSSALAELKAPLPTSSPVSQPSLQPKTAPEKGVRGPLSRSEKAADLAVPSVSSPRATSPIAAASVAREAELTPKISVTAIVGGEKRQAQLAVTPKMTVGQALAAMGVSLAILDRVTPEASALARNGLLIRVTRIASQLKTSRRAVPAELRYQPTTKLKAGTKSTIQEAKAGVMEVTQRVWTRDGKETKRDFVSQRIVTQPQHKIIALGVVSHLMPSSIRPNPRYARNLPSRGGSPRDQMLTPADPRTFIAVKSMTVLSTGYSAGPAGGSIGDWTATGVKCTYGAVAVDPRVIPLGSKLYIEGYGYGFACDVGGAIKGKHIDLAFNSARAANDHGRQMVKIWILGR